MTSLAARPPAFGAPLASGWDASAAAYRIDELSWGLRVRGRSGEPWYTRLGQGLAMMAGAMAATGGVALLLPLVGTLGGGSWAMRLGLGALIGGGGLLLIWFGSRGTMVETEVDAARGEIRVVVPNLVGGPTRMATHGIDSISGVSIRRGFGMGGVAVLALDLAGGGSVPVATGLEDSLTPLRRRLTRELMLGTQAFARMATDLASEQAGPRGALDDERQVGPGASVRAA